MLSQVVESAEILLAVLTFERFLSSMRSDMSSQMLGSGEGHRARRVQGTLESASFRFLLCTVDHGWHRV